mgnify:CR=1 FL=1
MEVKVKAKVEVEFEYGASREELGKETELKCYFCNGGLTKSLITYPSPLGITARNVPAFTCNQCGETYIDSETSRKLDELVKTAAKYIKSEEERMAQTYPKASNLPK